MRRIMIIAAIATTSALGVGVAHGQPNVLNCPDVYPAVNFPVPPNDPHNFDGNNDGIGCEDPTKGPGEYPAKAKPSSTPTEKSTPKPDTTKTADVPKSVPAGL